ncbi:MAG: adenylyl-sulfate kinase [Verrucomicrobia bacterium]|nr:MAG: adenylyl-sulfate kinase [Verrucomicrobiota bacterium]
MAGHVDHGKSTIIGRLLAETGALPQGKLEQVRETCRRNAKPFEYAFLLDALKDEQTQGITIDAARCFFRTAQRRYILIDAPGHVEFLKNMITGASRAEAALLVIDAKEGIRENTKRHGYMMSMLGLRQLSVLVNKMDLVGYSQEVFEKIRADYTAFLERLQLQPVSFIPVSGMQGVNIAARSAETPWYTGPTVLEQIDRFRNKEFPDKLPFRLPVQDIYKFTEQGDERRILAGTIETGSIAVGDEVVFQPSGKRSRIQSIEYFNGPTKTSASAGEAPGFTLDTQLYVKRGEWMTKADQPPLKTSTRFRVNLFWMGRAPLIKSKTYKLKLGAIRSPVKLVDVLAVLDATELSTVANKQAVERHDVAEVILETPKPVAFDIVGDIEQTGRLVIVDNYEIAGAGIILAAEAAHSSTLEEHIRSREIAWKNSTIAREERTASYGHGAKFVVFTSADAALGETFAQTLEKQLFAKQFKTYYLGIENVKRGLDADLRAEGEIHDDHIRRLGELARILTDAGQIFITSLAGVDDYDLQALALLNSPHEIMVINIGENSFNRFEPALNLAADTPVTTGVEAVWNLLRQRHVIVDYQI